MKITKFTILASILLVAVSTASPVSAGDWGYDDGTSSGAAKDAKGSSGAGSPPQTGSGSFQPGSLFGNTKKTPVSAGSPSGGAGGKKVPVRGTIVPNGPFQAVQTGAGSYGVELNPPHYDNAGKQKGNSLDEDDPHHGSVPENGESSSNQKPLRAKAQPYKAPPGPPSESQVVSECWQQMFQVAGDQKLTDEQKGAIDSLVKKRLSGGSQSAGEAKAIRTFWPKVTSYLVAHPEQKENYSQLLRALLRWRARMQAQTLGDAKLDAFASDENVLINEVLGPVRVAVDGEVPFTEEAVNAYSDMACFIFEQRNPNKSVNANDNREMFAKVVCEKYHRAPTAKDCAAMAAFDLSWAKFKIAWQQSDESGRGIMLSKLAGQGAGVAWAQVKDPLLEQVLTSWPSPKAAPPVEPMLAKAQSYTAVKKTTPTPPAKSGK